MAYLAWTDAIGYAELRARRPALFNRFDAWRPIARDIGERDQALADGAVTLFRFREDYGATFELRDVSAHAHPGLVPAGATGLDLAIRLVRHLNAGGRAAVHPEGAAGGGYGNCGALPGVTLDDPSPVDPVALTSTLALAVKNFDGAAMPHPYAATVAGL